MASQADAPISLSPLTPLRRHGLRVGVQLILNIVHERHNSLVLDAEICHRLLALHLRSIVLPQVGRVLNKLPLRAHPIENEVANSEGLHDGEKKRRLQAGLHRCTANSMLPRIFIEKGAGAAAERLRPAPAEEPLPTNSSKHDAGAKEKKQEKAKRKGVK